MGKSPASRPRRAWAASPSRAPARARRAAGAVHDAHDLSELPTHLDHDGLGGLLHSAHGERGEHEGEHGPQKQPHQNQGVGEGQVQGGHLVQVDDLRVGDAREGVPVQPGLQLVEPLLQIIHPAGSLHPDPLLLPIAAEDVRLLQGHRPGPVPAHQGRAPLQPGGQGLDLVGEGRGGDGHGRLPAGRIDADVHLHAAPPFHPQYSGKRAVCPRFPDRRPTAGDSRRAHAGVDKTLSTAYNIPILHRMGSTPWKTTPTTAMKPTMTR